MHYMHQLTPGGSNERSGFRLALQELGWVEGHNFRADYRWPSGDLDRMQAIAKEFVDLKPDVIFAGNTPSVVALPRETRMIPIVFANLADPVGGGVVGSLAHPGGNAKYSLAGKWLIKPDIVRVSEIGAEPDVRMKIVRLFCPNGPVSMGLSSVKRLALWFALHGVAAMPSILRRESMISPLKTRLSTSPILLRIKAQLDNLREVLSKKRNKIYSGLQRKLFG
jgi:hypothetical protein